MKKILKPLFCAAALVSLAGCNKFDEANATPETSNGSLIKVYANVAENDGTRANINVGESVFTAEWEAGDALGILPVKTGGTAPATAAKFDYNTASAAFEGSLNDFVAGGGNYYAFFPHAQVTGTTANLPFGNLRTQTGNDFNSAYDALVATPQAYGAADEAGKVDGNPVAFTLHRLTSILDFSIATQADKVKYLLLTAGGETQKLSASSLDFALENGGAETATTLSTTDQSNVIALQYTPDGASADKVEAFFNVPADLYPTLTLDVIGSDNQMATVTVNRTEAFKAGTLYTKAVSDLQFAPIDAPSLVWPGEDGKEIGDVHDLTTDESGTSLNYSAAVDIVVPGGIAGLKVDIESPALNAIGITTLNIFNETEIPGLGISYEMLGLSCGAQVQYQKACVFNITNLVPMILVLEQMGIDASLIYCQHTFNVTVTDLAGQSTTQPLVFDASPKVALTSADLWANTATLALNSIPSEATSVSVQYKKSTETTWQDAEVSSDKKTASIKPEWEDKTAADWTTPNTVLAYSRIKTGTGIFADNTYDYKLSVDETEYTGQFTTDPGDIIPNGDMEDSTLPCFTQDGSASTTFWGSGNNSYAKSLCSPATFNGMGGRQCAKLAATMAGVSFYKLLAAGNLFTGTFSKPLFTGFVNFGQGKEDFTFTARPTALKVKYHAKVGIVDQNSHKGPLEKNANVQDKARIFVCIVDWDQRHEVTSGTSDPTGIWDPETTTNPGEGAIIGYGSLFIDQTTAGDSMVETELKINYYDKETKPSKNYQLIISCATSAYGDYMNGCSTNEMYVDDFEWVY